MRRPITIVIGTLAVALATIVAKTALQVPAGALDPAALREYSGVYQWAPGSFVYLQAWNEFTGADQLVAFDESGEVRVLYPAGRDRFTTGRAAAVPVPART